MLNRHKYATPTKLLHLMSLLPFSSWGDKMSLAQAHSTASTIHRSTSTKQCFLKMHKEMFETEGKL